MEEAEEAWVGVPLSQQEGVEGATWEDVGEESEASESREACL